METILAVEELKSALYNDINNSHLGIVPVYYIVKDIYAEIIQKYNAELENLKIQAQAQIQNEEQLMPEKTEN